MASFRNRPGEAVLPRFRFEQATDLADASRALGIPDAFERDRVDLSGMSEATDLFASSLRQLTLLDINERGTEAAAATTMMIMRSLMLRVPSSPFLMVVGHSFWQFETS